MSASASALVAAAAVNDGDLWPLPLTPFEKFLWFSEQPGSPMTIIGDYELEGTLDRERFATAIRMALKRHPLLRASIEGDDARTLRWVPTTHEPFYDWAEAGTPLPPRLPQPDLRRESPLHFVVRTGNGRTRLIYHGHHAPADAVGSAQFMADVFTSYAELSGQSGVAALPTLDPSRLKRRGDLGRYRLERKGPWLDRLRRLRDAIRFAWEAPRPIVTTSTTADSAMPTSYPALVIRRFDAAETERIRQSARAGEGTLNDSAIAALLQTTARWNRERGRPRDRDRIRVMVPYELRTRDDLRLPAANVLSLGFITRRFKDCDDLTSLQNSIRDETQTVKQGRYAIDFLLALEELDRLGRLASVARRQQCLATTVLSHVKEPMRLLRRRVPERDGKFVCGDVLIDALEGGVPLRPLTEGAMFVSTCSGRLSFSLRRNPAAFSEPDAEEFMRRFTDRFLAAIDG